MQMWIANCPHPIANREGKQTAYGRPERWERIEKFALAPQRNRVVETKNSSRQPELRRSKT